jgi:hypothetical protein
MQRSANMLPVLIADDEVDQPLAHLEGFCQFVQRASRLTQSANRPDFLSRQLRRSLFLTNATAPSSLFHHILHVLFVSGEKQMRRVTAKSVVASVTDFKFCWHRPISHNPGDHVCHPASNLSVKRAKLTVPSVRGTHRPRPAFIFAASVNFGPKMGDRIGDFGRHCAIVLKGGIIATS